MNNDNNDYLPEMIEAPEEENIQISIEEEAPEGEDNPNFIYSDDDDDDDIPHVIEKGKLNQDDIFSSSQVKKVSNKNKDPPAVRKLSDVPLTKSGKPKRKPTQKQLDHLATIRAKGQETRRKNMIERQKAKAEGKEIPKSVRRKKEIIETQKLIVTQKERMSKEEIEEITFNAISKHEEMRKKRKEEKKKKLEEEGKTAEIQRTIRRATGNPDPNDVWGSALSGMFN